MALWLVRYLQLDSGAMEPVPPIPTRLHSTQSLYYGIACGVVAAIHVTTPFTKNCRRLVAGNTLPVLLDPVGSTLTSALQSAMQFYRRSGAQVASG